MVRFDNDIGYISFNHGVRSLVEKQAAVLATIREIMNKAEETFTPTETLLSAADQHAALKIFNQYLTKKIFALLDKMIEHKLV